MRVPVVDRLAQVIRLVDFRHGPGALQAEDGENQQRFQDGLTAGHEYRVWQIQQDWQGRRGRRRAQAGIAVVRWL